MDFAEDFDKQVEEYITFAEKAKTKEEQHIFYKKAEELFKKNSLQQMKDNSLNCQIRISETYEKMGNFSGACCIFEPFFYQDIFNC